MGSNLFSGEVANISKEFCKFKLKDLTPVKVLIIS